MNAKKPKFQKFATTRKNDTLIWDSLVLFVIDPIFKFITQTIVIFLPMFPNLLSISFVYQQILWHSFSIWKISKTNTIKFSGCHGPQKIKSWHKKLICTWLSQPVFTINHFGFYWTNNFNLTTTKYIKGTVWRRLFTEHKTRWVENWRKKSTYIIKY